MGRLRGPGRRGKAALAAALICLLAVGGCTPAAPPAASSSSVQSSAPGAEESAQPPREPSGGAPSSAPFAQDPESEGPSESPYLNGLIADTIAKFAAPDMSEYEKAKAAFDYMIENTVLDEPIGLDLWRIHDGGEQPLSFVENRSLSVLLFGVGMCEDYAAAFTMLLRGMGLEAQYVPGLTYSAEGHLVDHAWTVAKIDGAWYHLDCQLEDNVSRHGAIRYRYFMKGDATMSASHRWGQNLIDANLLTQEQNAQIAERFLCPPCVQDYPTPPRQTFTQAPAPDLGAMKAWAREEKAAYEAEHGELPPLQLDIIPPVFGAAGFGPPDEG